MRSDVYELALGAFRAQDGDEGNALFREVRRAQKELASKGIVGGGGIMVLRRVGEESIRRCGSIASAQLKRACISCGHNASRSDLEEAWDNLLTQSVRRTQMCLSEALVIHATIGPAAANTAAETICVETRNNIRLLAVAEFAHFVAENARDQRGRVRGTLSWVGAGFVGAFSARTPDFIGWFANRGLR